MSKYDPIDWSSEADKESALNELAAEMRVNEARRKAVSAEELTSALSSITHFLQHSSTTGGGCRALRTKPKMTPAQHAANQRIMPIAIDREYRTHLETGSPYSQDKAIMDAIQEEEFSEPLDADDWGAYIYDLAFRLEAKLGINPHTHA